MVLAMSRPLKHRRSGVYYFRKVVPQDLRALLGRTEVMSSLGTKDPAEAKIRHALRAAEVDREWRRLRTPSRSLSQKEAIALIGRWYDWYLKQHEENPGDPADWYLGMDQLRDLREWGLGSPDEDPEEQRPPRITKRVREFLTGAADVQEFLVQEGMNLAPEALEAFLDALEEQFLAAHRRLARFAAGDYSPDPAPVHFPTWHAPEEAEQRRGNSVSFETLVAGWWREAQAVGRSPSTYQSYSATFAKLQSFLGHEDAARVTPDRKSVV